MGKAKRNKKAQAKHEQSESNQAQQTQQKAKPASLRRRLAALLYDTLLVIAALVIASMLYIIPAQLLSGGASSGADNLSTTAYDTATYRAYLFIVGYLFLGWFWTHGGQTLGLRVWKLRIETLDGYAISWWQAMFRYLAACFPWFAALFAYWLVNEAELMPSNLSPFVFILGFSGYAWMFFNPEKMTLQDKFSESRIIQLPPKNQES